MKDQSLFFPFKGITLAPIVPSKEKTEEALAEAVIALNLTKKSELIVDHDVGDRLLGSRIAAGYISQKLLRERLNVPDATYRHAENGIRSVNSDILAGASGLTGVTVDFLLTGEPNSDREHLAARLALALDVVRRTGDDEWPERLERIRIASGYRTAMEAAQANGWPVSTYNAHEFGSRRMSVARYLGYCLRLGGSIDYAVRGELPIVSEQKVEWSEMNEATPAGHSPKW